MKFLKVAELQTIYRNLQVITIPYTALKHSKNMAVLEGSELDTFGSMCLIVISVWRELKGITGCLNSL